VNKVEEWHCFKCKVKMVNGRVRMSYLGKIVPIQGIKCPRCGVAYLPEEIVLGKVAKAEEMIENK
jgi:hypothetical protein